MRRTKRAALVMLAIGIPIGLALAAYGMAVRFGVSTSVPALPAGIERHVDGRDDGRRPSPSASERSCGDSSRDRQGCATATPGSSPVTDDHGGLRTGDGSGSGSGSSPGTSTSGISGSSGSGSSGSSGSRGSSGGSGSSSGDSSSGSSGGSGGSHGGGDD